MKQKLKFPEGFLWGAGTSAHQVEGNNTNSDWWAWEHSRRRHEDLRAEGKDPRSYESGLACDAYRRFDEDFSLAAHLGHNATRLSVEWARIEPEPGVFSERELDHYEEVLRSARYHGLKTFVTLHHYTNPRWFLQAGGFERPESVLWFERYAKTAVDRLSEYVDFWITINEPEVYFSHSYLLGLYPPQRRSPTAAFRVLKNLLAAHNQVAPYIRRHHKKPVSMAYHLSDLRATNWLAWPTRFVVDYLANRYTLQRTVKECDFIGLNYYFHHHVGLLGRRHHSSSNHETSDLGWGLHPEGLERVLLGLRRYRKPIYITENGLADAGDTRREKFIKDHLYHAHRAIAQGVDLRGYLHWSLIDNFEWAEGFGPRFGLIEVDYGNLLERRVRYSATRYAEICRTNTLEV